MVIGSPECGIMGGAFVSKSRGEIIQPDRYRAPSAERRRHLRGRGRKTSPPVIGVLLAGAALSLTACPAPDPPGPAGPDASPQVYRTPHLQAPVRIAAGDVVAIPGRGFQPGARVVYRFAPDPAAPPAPEIPLGNSMTEGELDLPDFPSGTPDAYADVPDSLLAKVPPQVQPERPYVLHVLNPDNNWSQPIPVNHARPLWVSPDLAYSTAAVPGLPRTLKIVGRNLRPVGGSALVRLVGPETYTRPASAPSGPTGDYVLEVQLPQAMVPGEYRVGVESWGVWHTATANRLEVRADPGAKPLVPLTGCSANDGDDDTECIAAAISSAVALGGGEVVFGPGQWDLVDLPQVNPSIPGWLPRHGIVVPPGVDLVGHPGAIPVLAKHPSWSGPPPGSAPSVFTLEGRNEIRGLRFIEIVPPGEAPTPEYAFFRLGRLPAPVEQVTFNECSFNHMHMAIGDRGFPLRRIYVTGNEFEASSRALRLEGNPALKDLRFAVGDSVFARNRFLAGLDADTIASELGAGERVDFSDNAADGTGNGGWRAAFFWHMEDNQEMVLVSGNQGTCTGDKGGDGEFLSFDDNRNLTGFDSKRPVVASGPGFVQVEGPWRESTADFYLGMWTAVVRGPGRGQARKIVAYTDDAQPVIHVDPPWDVVPEPGVSEIVVARAAWSTYLVDNEIDNSPAAGCSATNPQGGIIGNATFSFDSTIDGNRMHRSGGIHLSKGYGTEAGFPAWTYARVSYATEIRNNLIDLEPSTGPGKGGIEIWYGTNLAGQASILQGHNLSIARNTISAADGSLGGAVSTTISHDQAEEPCTLTGVLIFGNTIEDVPVGVLIDGKPDFPATCRAVLYDNSFVNVPTTVGDNGTETVFF